MPSKKITVTPQSKANKINSLGSKLAVLPHDAQRELFVVERQAEFEGIEMGVLSSGMPYLSERGLAGMCGIDNTVLNEMATNWEQEQARPRGRQIKVLLRKSGYAGDGLFMRSVHNGREVNAYPEPVCIALLEYYAFITKDPKEMAQYNFRNLARVKFREYVYQAVGYSPEQKAMDSWRHFHDRVDLTKNAVPHGYFGVYGEIAPILVPMITSGIDLNEKFIPDISAGRNWSKHWADNNFDAKYGMRKRYDHSYPDYYPQAKSNPQDSYAYPDTALAEFRRWLRQQYLVKDMPGYLARKVKDDSISFSAATRATLALTSNGTATGKRLTPR